MTEPTRFEGTKSYIATNDLKVAVNAAVTLRRPLLVKGEPGTGKTVLAHEISKALDAPLIVVVIAVVTTGAAFGMLLLLFTSVVIWLGLKLSGQTLANTVAKS